jgi:hypothetical protein
VLILFDHGTPKGLIRALAGHTVHTAQAKGWDTLGNGALLKGAEEAGFEVLVTTDPRSLPTEPGHALHCPHCSDREHEVVARSAAYRPNRGCNRLRDPWQLF